MSEVTIIPGDCVEELPKLRPLSIQEICTSIPYWGLRIYGIPATAWPTIFYSPMSGIDPITIPAWSGCLGNEPDIAAFVGHVVHVFRMARPALRLDGTVWLNVGDSAANDDKWGGSTGGKHAKVLHGQTGIGRAKKHTGLPPKSLAGIPWRVAFALQTDGWILRSEVIWHKTTCAPDPAQDRLSRVHEQIFLFAQSRRYYYDADAIREPLRPKTLTTFGTLRRPKSDDALIKGDNFGHTQQERKPRLKADGQPAGANKRDVWSIAPQKIAGHNSSYPERLVEPCILAGSRPGDTVLDPFAGSGTTLRVAAKLGRDAIGFELKPEYCALAQERTNGVQTRLEAV